MRNQSRQDDGWSICHPKTCTSLNPNYSGKDTTPNGAPEHQITSNQIHCQQNRAKIFLLIQEYEGRTIMQTRNYLDQADKLMERIKQGAFLTVKAKRHCNTMTIGWATIGIIWQRPIFMIAVRDSRHTFTLIEKTDNFTVSIPQPRNTIRP